LQKLEVALQLFAFFGNLKVAEKQLFNYWVPLDFQASILA
jgi:hypothetical protein